MEAREVLGAAYGRYLPKKMLTHAVVMINGRDAFVCCTRVLTDNLADAGSLDEAGRKTEPTCLRCGQVWRKWHAATDDERSRMVVPLAGKVGFIG